MEQKRGAYIVFEGLNKSGKTTQLQLLEQEVQRRGIEYLLNKEPGSQHSQVCKDFRRILLNEDGIDNYELAPAAQLLGFYADRANGNALVVGPAMESGKLVLQDRSDLSTKVFQGYTEGLGLDICETLGSVAYKHKPDLTLFFDVPLEETLRRKGLMQDQTYDRYEELEAEKVRKHYEGYQYVVGIEPNVYRIDGTQTIEQVHYDVVNLLEDKLPHIFGKELNVF